MKVTKTYRFLARESGTGKIIGTALIGSAKAEPLVRRVRTLVDLAIEIVRLGR